MAVRFFAEMESPENPRGAAVELEARCAVEPVIPADAFSLALPRVFT